MIYARERLLIETLGGGCHCLIRKRGKVGRGTQAHAGSNRERAAEQSGPREGIHEDIFVSYPLVPDGDVQGHTFMLALVVNNGPLPVPHVLLALELAAQAAATGSARRTVWLAIMPVSANHLIIPGDMLTRVGPRLEGNLGLARVEDEKSVSG